jgi:hypothetical protein
VIAAGISISSRFMIVTISSGDIVSRFMVSGFRCSVVRIVIDGSMGDSFRFVCRGSIVRLPAVKVSVARWEGISKMHCKIFILD